MPGYLVRITLIMAFVQFINALEYMIFNPLFALDGADVSGAGKPCGLRHRHLYAGFRHCGGQRLAMGR